jgi:hypothetical protein
MVWIIGFIIAGLIFFLSANPVLAQECMAPSVDGLCGQGTPFSGGDDGTIWLIVFIIFGLMWLGKTNGE